MSSCHLAAAKNMKTDETKNHLNDPSFILNYLQSN